MPNLGHRNLQQKSLIKLDPELDVIQPKPDSRPHRLAEAQVRRRQPSQPE